jgi:hypothetical protein
VEVAKFCDPLDSVALQELILTGGGAAIPAVRCALIDAALTGRAFFRVHAPGVKQEDVSGRGHPLGEDLARGGSAVGGASIYFEKEYN